MSPDSTPASTPQSAPRSAPTSDMATPTAADVPDRDIFSDQEVNSSGHNPESMNSERMNPDHMNPELVNWVIRQRRSTKPRCLNGQKIDDAIVWQILENANWAPTNGLTQPWRFKVFTGKGLETLAQFQADLYKALTPEASFRDDKYERMKTNVLKASHVIIICMKRQESEKLPEIEEIEAVACSVQNMALTAAAYGICSFWGSGGVTYTDELKTFLGLSDRDRCLGYLYLGYSDTPSKDSKRSPIQSKVDWFG